MKIYDLTIRNFPKIVRQEYRRLKRRNWPLSHIQRGLDFIYYKWKRIIGHRCPICSRGRLNYVWRHPKYVCGYCRSMATDINGRSLSFANAGSGDGGYSAVYSDNREIYNSKVCYINGIKCWADEYIFGGIVIEVLENSER